MKHGFKALMAADRSLPAKRTVQLTDGSVEYLTDGEGQPGIVLVNGFGMPLTGWALVFPELAKISTVFACDLVGAGVGGGRPPRGPQAKTGSGTAAVDQLRGALAAAGVQPPYVLVGHALGGLYANLYARLFPRELAGLVLLEPTHSDDDVLDRHVRFFPRAVTRALIASTLAAQQRLMSETAREIEQAGPFPDLPLAVISGGKVPSRLTTSRRQIASHAARQQQLAALSAAAKHIVAPNTGHYPHITDPGIVVQAVREIVSSSFWPCGGDADRPLRPNPTALSNPGPAADGAAEGDAQAPVSQCLAASSRGTAEGDHAVIRRRRHVTRVPAFEDQCWDGVQDDAAWPNRPGLPRTSSRLNFRTTRTELNWPGVRVTVQRCGCWLTCALSPAAGDWGPCSCAERLRSHAGFGDARDNR